MTKTKILVEIVEPVQEAFARFSAAASSPKEAVRQSESLIGKLTGVGLDLSSDAAPVPMFDPRKTPRIGSLSGGPDLSASATIVACEADRSKIDDLKRKSNIKVWPNSTMTSFDNPIGAFPCRCKDTSAPVSESIQQQFHLFDLASSAVSRVDCLPYRTAVSVADIRELLAVNAAWSDGFRGQNVVVGILDDGISSFYPVIGGHERSGGPRPGTARIDSHGSMCAAGIRVAAPFAKLLDYPFLSGSSAGDSFVAIEMFNAVLDQRRIDGTPHLTSNSYGFTRIPSKVEEPNHESYDRDHPLNRKVLEVIKSGCACFFAAGNCGSQCPSSNCHSSVLKEGCSISAANSLAETLTIAAVNSRHERIGYSAQGPGTLHDEKPDFSAYSHFFGNFGPSRPAGGDQSRFDNGTSAACPVAAGVGALLLSVGPALSPTELRDLLVRSAIDLNCTKLGWNSMSGHGVVNAGVAYNLLRRRAASEPKPGDDKMPREIGVSMNGESSLQKSKSGPSRKKVRK